MPRVSAIEKARTHSRIVEIASNLFREHGIGGASVADVMQAAGLTHGGFYRHFESKDALVAAAFDHAVSNSVRAMTEADSDVARRKAWAAYRDLYLSVAHLENWAAGCPIAALAAEVSREGGISQQVASNCLDDAQAALANVLPDSIDSGTIMALLVGTVTLARMDSNSKVARRRLKKAQITISKLIESGSS